MSFLINDTTMYKQLGGRNVPQPKNRAKLSRRRSRRKSRRRSPHRSRRRSGKSKSYFKRSNKLSEPHRRYCRCVLHVADKQSTECLRDKKWGQVVNGKQCFNPFAICSKSTSRKGAVECFKNLDLTKIPKSELSALANLKKLTTIQLRLKQKMLK